MINFAKNLKYIKVVNSICYIIVIINILKMKKRISLLLFFVFAMANAQVGIKKSTDIVPNGYVFPDPSAVLDIYSTDKGLLFPRINLGNVGALTSATSPVNSPAQGLILYNSTENTTNKIKKGLYYWDVDPLTNVSKYNRILPFLETPKVMTVELNTDLKVLEGANQGDRTFYSSEKAVGIVGALGTNNGNPSGYNTMLKLDSGYLYNARVDHMYFDIVGDTYGIVLPAGIYNFEINYLLNAPTASARSGVLVSNPTSSINNNYYDMGYFNDIYVVPFVSNTSTTPLPNPVGSANRKRSEAHTTTKLGLEHSVNYFYTLSFDVETFVFFSIGRVTQTSFFDAANLLKNGSYIKINKLN